MSWSVLPEFGYHHKKKFPDRTVYYNEVGQRHRTDGPAVEEADGSKFWYINDKLHRTDGPAREYASGSKYWYINDKLHREDGPATEYANGDKFWFINGRQLTEEEFNRRTRNASLKLSWKVEVLHPKLSNPKPGQKILVISLDRKSWKNELDDIEFEGADYPIPTKTPEQQMKEYIRRGTLGRVDSIYGAFAVVEFPEGDFFLPLKDFDKYYKIVE